MDDGLVPICIGSYSFGSEVLILVVVDDGLVPVVAKAEELGIRGLNPCCSGRWSSTRPYKTLLIINKLKSFTKEIFTSLN